MSGLFKVDEIMYRNVETNSYVEFICSSEVMRRRNEGDSEMGERGGSEYGATNEGEPLRKNIFVWGDN